MGRLLGGSVDCNINSHFRKGYQYGVSRQGGRHNCYLNGEYLITSMHAIKATMMKLSISILRRRKASAGYVNKSASCLRQVIILIPMRGTTLIPRAPLYSIPTIQTLPPSNQRSTPSTSPQPHKPPTPASPLKLAYTPPTNPNSASSPTLPTHSSPEQPRRDSLPPAASPRA